MGVKGLAGPRRNKFGVGGGEDWYISVTWKDLGLRWLHLFPWTQGGASTAKPGWRGWRNPPEHIPVKRNWCLSQRASGPSRVQISLPQTWVMRCQQWQLTLEVLSSALWQGASKRLASSLGLWNQPQVFTWDVRGSSTPAWEEKRQPLAFLRKFSPAPRQEKESSLPSSFPQVNTFLR